ncbi:MAG: hypothetical protein QXS21_05475 [Thermoproteota archaeon]
MSDDFERTIERCRGKLKSMGFNPIIYKDADKGYVVIPLIDIINYIANKLASPNVRIYIEGKYMVMEASRY